MIINYHAILTHIDLNYNIIDYIIIAHLFLCIVIIVTRRGQLSLISSIDQEVSRLYIAANAPHAFVPIIYQHPFRQFSAVDRLRSK